MKGAKKLAKEISKELMTMNYGNADANKGDRLAIMKMKYGRERKLGGRCQQNVIQVITKHLERHREK